MISFDASEIADWASLPDAQHQLPQLLRRLVLATTDSLTKVRFPSGSSVTTPGFDGEVGTSSGNPWVPSGSSYWEVSTNGRPREKAESDYEKRSTGDEAEIDSEGTYVAVTARRWRNKGLWEQQKRGDRVWSGVRVVDADDLVAWLEQAPAVAYWFAKLIGKTPPTGWISLEDWWESWSHSGDIVTTGMALAGRDEDVVSVQRWLTNEADQYYVQSDTIDDSIAFIAALAASGENLQEARILGRSVVIEDESAWRDFESHASPLIMLRRFRGGNIANSIAVSNGHRVITPLAGSEGVSGKGTKLSRLDGQKLVEAFVSIGKSETQARAIVRRGANRLAIIRRGLIDEVGGEVPSWVNEVLKPEMNSVVLFGQWDESKDGDKQIVTELTASSYESVELQAIALVSSIDAPIEHVGTHWRLISPEESWQLVAPRLAKSDIDRFAEIAIRVLSTLDPKFELKPNQRYMANVVGKESPYSESLVSGISRALALLGVYPEAVSNVPQVENVAFMVVSEILGEGKSWATWATLSSNLSTLAEAAPNAFLESVEDALNTDPDIFRGLLVQDENILLSGAPHAGLLWALERVAWSEQHFPRVVEILARLSEVDLGGSVSNRPVESLRTLFLSWIKFSEATDEARLAALERLVSYHSDVAWNLLIELATSRNDHVMERDPPNWRPWCQDGKPIQTVGGRNAYLQSLFPLLIGAAAKCPNRWAKLVDNLPDYPSEIRAEMLQCLKSMAPEFASHKRRDELRDRIRRELHTYRKYKDDSWRISDAESQMLHEIYLLLEPSDVGSALGWMFDEETVPPPDFQKDPNIESLIGIDDFDDLNNARRQAIRSAYGKGCDDALIELIHHTSKPKNVGFAAGHELAIEIVVGLVSEYLVTESDQHFEFAKGLLWSLATRTGWDGLDAVLRDCRQPLKAHGIAAVYLAAQPADKSVWERLSREEASVQWEYWRVFQPFLAEPRDADTMQFVTKMLMVHGRESEMLNLLSMTQLEAGFLIAFLERLPRNLSRKRDGLTRISGKGYAIAQLFDQLDASPEVDDSVIAGLEIPYLWIFRDVRKDLAIGREVLKNPRNFADLISMLFKRSDCTSESTMSDEAVERNVRLAYQILQNVRAIPGIRSGGSVDFEELVNWVLEARRICEERDRGVIGDEQIGEVLANSPTGSDGIWPCEPVRDLLENVRSTELVRGIVTGRVNQRGATSRRAGEGGDQERELVDSYRSDAMRVLVKWPFTAKLLNDLADFYDRDARWHDDIAEQREWE